MLVSYANTVEGGEPATWIVEEGRLRAALLAAAADRSTIELLGEAPAVGFAADEHGVDVALAGAPARAHAARASLVAADGRASPLREAAGIGVVRWSYPQTGIVTTVRLARPHDGRAVQHFPPAGPLPPSWRTAPASPGPRMPASRAASWRSTMRASSPRSRGVSATASAPIALAGPRASWPLDMHLARALVANRFALIGDAAHGVHPIAGQGLNLGLGMLPRWPR